MDKKTWNIGRLFYGIPLSVTGLIYLFKPQESVESLTSFIPGGVFLIYVAGFLWFFLGASIAFDFKTRFASQGVVFTLALYQIMVHIPAATAGEHLPVVWFELLRDVSLIGGALFIWALSRKEEGHGHHHTSSSTKETHYLTEF